MNMERRRISSLKQLELLVEFTEKNRDLALGRLRSKEARHIAARLWKDCADKLNPHGPARTPKEWTKTWTDFKSKVRLKLTGIADPDQKPEVPGEPPTVVTLSALEKRVAKLIGDRTYSSDDRNYVVQDSMDADRQLLLDTAEQMPDQVTVSNETSNIEEISDEPDLIIGPYQEFNEIVEVEVVQLSADDPLAFQPLSSQRTPVSQTSTPQKTHLLQTSAPQQTVWQTLPKQQKIVLRSSPSQQTPRLKTIHSHQTAPIQATMSQQTLRIQTAPSEQTPRIHTAPLPKTLRLHTLSKQETVQSHRLAKQQNLLRISPSQQTSRSQTTPPLQTIQPPKRPRLQTSPAPQSPEWKTSPPQTPPLERTSPLQSPPMQTSPTLQSPPMQTSPPPQIHPMQTSPTPQIHLMETSPPPHTHPMQTSPPPQKTPQSPLSTRHRRVRSQRKATKVDFHTQSNSQLDESRMMVLKIEEMRARTDSMLAEASLRREEAMKIQAEAALASAEADRFRAQVIATIFHSMSTLVPTIRRYLEGLTKTRRMSSSSAEETFLS